MKYPTPFLLFLAAITLCRPGVVSAEAARLDEKTSRFFQNYCVECHNEQKQKGKLRLDDIPLEISTVELADRWQKILNQLNAGEMPPEDTKQPDRLAKTDFLETLSHTMVTARQSHGDVRGKITMRRLNRREYKNTIRDLLGVDLRVNELPADGGAGTFDTVGSSLFMSSDQFEQYLSLGRQAIDEHFARALPPGHRRRLHIEVEENANPRIAKALKDREDARQRYVKWTTAVDAAAEKPENKGLAEQIRAEKKDDATHLYFQWQRLPGSPMPADFGFTDATHADEQGRRDWMHYVPHHRAYVQHPATKTGTFLTIEDVFVNSFEPFLIPKDWPIGDYVVRVRIAATDAAPKERRFVEFGPRHASGAAAVASTHQVTGTMDKPQILEIPLKVTGASDRVYFFRERGSKESDQAANRIFAEALRRNGVGPEFALWIDWIEVESAGSDARPGAVKTIRERREVELHANAIVGGTYNGYYKEGYRVAKAYLDSDRTRPPTAFGKGIPDEIEARFRVKVFEQHGPTFERYLNDPLTRTGALLTIFNAHTEEVITLPPDQPSGWLKTRHEIESAPSGEYLLRFRIGAVKGTPAERHFVALGSRKAKDDFALVQTFQISGTTDVPQMIEVPVSVTADSPRTFVLREKRDVKRDNDWYEATRKETGVGPPAALWIDWVEWQGPLSGDAGRSDIQPVVFENTSSLLEPEHARAVITRFAERAFRDKKPEAGYIDRLVRLYEMRRQAGDSHAEALKEPLSVVLASPGFLYISEPGDESKPRQLADLELATRLSYFLWSAPPDDTLLALARKDELHKPEVLQKQVGRMIADYRSSAFVSGFVHQWLGMERLDFFQFDTAQFPDFDESTRAAARREVYESFAHLLHAVGNDGSLANLLKSDYVVLNGLLATYYGIPDVAGDEFRKVTVPPGSPRGGLLGMAAILAMGSNGERTSPVERGAWVLRKLLHDPPPPAPPNVPQLTRLENKLLTTRERVLAHQEQPQCAQCHRKIDPIGFGLENFNAAGKWRTEDFYEKRGVGKKIWKIDPAGAFHKGPAFHDYFELRDLVAQKREAFARGFTESLIEYGLGRPHGFTDSELEETIIKQAAEQNFEVRAFITALVRCPEFRRK